MLSLKELRMGTPAKIKANANGVRTLKITAVMSKDERGKHKHVAVQCLGDTIPRFVVMRLYDPDKGLDSPVWLTCSCEFWLFNCEYAVNKVGSTFIRKCNGDKPDIRNYGRIPYCCKHIYAVAEDAIKASTGGGGIFDIFKSKKPIVDQLKQYELIAPAEKPKSEKPKKPKLTPYNM